MMCFYRLNHRKISHNKGCDSVMDSGSSGHGRSCIYMKMADLRLEFITSC